MYLLFLLLKNYQQKMGFFGNESELQSGTKKLWQNHREIWGREEWYFFFFFKEKRGKLGRLL